MVNTAGLSVSSAEEGGNGVVSKGVSSDEHADEDEHCVLVGFSVLSTAVVKIVDVGTGEGDGEVPIGLN